MAHLICTGERSLLPLDTLSYVSHETVMDIYGETVLSMPMLREEEGAAKGISNLCCDEEPCGWNLLVIIS
jgi:hypothetical protein